MADFERACQANYTNKSEVLRRAMLDYVRQNQKGVIKMTKVVIIEAGLDYTERLETFEANISTVEEAIAEVESMGYTVIPNSEGGQNEICSDTDSEYIAITVKPNLTYEEVMDKARHLANSGTFTDDPEEVADEERSGSCRKCPRIVSRGNCLG